MSIATKPLTDFVRELPVDIQIEVRDFAEFLLAKRQVKVSKPLRQNWAGALQKYQERYTSLELQKKALEWRCDDVLA
jgi:hypothetical protein